MNGTRNFPSAFSLTTKLPPGMMITKDIILLFCCGNVKKLIILCVRCDFGKKVRRTLDQIVVQSNQELDASAHTIILIEPFT